MRSGQVEFVERPPWWGGDLQTMRNQIVVHRVPLVRRATPLRLPASDGSGDVLTGSLHEPENGSGGPAIFLIHGLTGCEDSTYVRQTTAYHLSLGRKVVRVNLRGAGSSRITARGYYYGGCTSDVQDMLDGLEPSVTRSGVFAIGYSLGGNILLNFLAQLRNDHPLIGAATVSAPINPAEACARLMSRRNMIYHYFLLRNMKRQALSPYADLTAHEQRAIQSARSIYAFDDDFTAPRHGYRSADDYYAKTAGYQFVAQLEIPTLLLHARNDPWIPSGPYLELLQQPLGQAEIVLAPSGGHVGFHDRASSAPWHDRVVNRFLETVAGSP